VATLAGVEEQPRAWYAPGLLRRIQEARRFRPQPVQRKSFGQLLRERGLHWSVELVVGVFVAVVAVSLVTVALGSGAVAGARQTIETGVNADGSGGSTRRGPAPTPDCIAAPIPGSTKRVCAN